LRRRVGNEIDLRVEAKLAHGGIARPLFRLAARVAPGTGALAWLDAGRVP
jgi:hypothetical protein